MLYIYIWSTAFTGVFIIEIVWQVVGVVWIAQHFVTCSHLPAKHAILGELISTSKQPSGTCMSNQKLITSTFIAFYYTLKYVWILFALTKLLRQVVSVLSLGWLPPTESHTVLTIQKNKIQLGVSISLQLPTMWCWGILPLTERDNPSVMNCAWSVYSFYTRYGGNNWNSVS